MLPHKMKVAGLFGQNGVQNCLNTSLTVFQLLYFMVHYFGKRRKIKFSVQFRITLSKYFYSFQYMTIRIKFNGLRKGKSSIL